MCGGAERWRRLSGRLNSFSVKLAVIALVLAVVPVQLYRQFQAADSQRNELLLRLVQEQGRLAGEAVFPVLDRFTPRSLDQLEQSVRQLAESGLSIKVLFSPAAPAAAQRFLLVAAAPETTAEEGRQATERLVHSGVLEKLTQSCQGRSPLALRLPHGDSPAAGDELLTYIGPHTTAAGCWVVVASQPTGSLPERVIGQPFWRTPEVQAAGAVYLLMVVLVLSVFADAWRGLRRFRDVAQKVMRGRPQSSFATGSTMPELAGVARDLDSMVTALKRSEGLLRQAAEENAHALKAPLAVISQSLEPLRRTLRPEDTRAHRSLEVIEQSVTKLDHLVSTVRRIDETIAGLIDCPKTPVAVSALLDQMGQGYLRVAGERGVTLTVTVAPGVTVAGSAEMVETIVENLLDNALDFSPTGGAVAITLSTRDGQAVLRVEDQGPGVAATDLERIFERHLSSRPAGHGADAEHYGLGLWIVRRNAEAMGGRATAANREPGGLVVSVEMPLSRSRR